MTGKEWGIIGLNMPVLANDYRLDFSMNAFENAFSIELLNTNMQQRKILNIKSC